MPAKAGRPYFATPPRDYDQRYMNDLIRAFGQFATDVANPGEGRNTTIVLTDLQNSNSSLEVGALFEQGGRVYVTLANIPAPAGIAASGSVGTVTVSTP